MDYTIPGRSLNAQFAAIWRRFERLTQTTDSLRSLPARLRRWWMPVNVSFIIPIEDPIVCNYLRSVQDSVRPVLAYAPQPPDKLHITLFQLGYLRPIPFPLLGGWSPRNLKQIADLAGQYLALVKPFEVQIGPVNAFPNVAIVEVHDWGKLRLLSGVVSKAVPPLQVPLSPYPMVPHVTLGYFGKQQAGPVRNVIRPLRKLLPTSFLVDQVELTLYYPKPGRYDLSQILQESVEEVVATLPLGEPDGHLRSGSGGK